jgi:peptide-methionine (R)-S-oxide reductase
MSSPKKVVHTEEEWRQLLSDAQFRVLRKEGTERPWSSPLNEEKRPGTYFCAGCEQPLFTAVQKFDSGAGWLSFFDVIDRAVGTKRDRKLILPRTELHYASCGGHQSHVFREGPPPTGLRFCNNGVALKFVPEKA